MPPRRIVGCMSGTSLDGLDAALVEVHGRGLGLQARFIKGDSRALGELAAEFAAFANRDESLGAAQIASLTARFTALHIALVTDLLAGEQADLIAVHGQTVFHSPPLSWQLFAPTALAVALRTPVVCDLRAADLACGGQGAPITPLADLLLFGHETESRAVVNLGGFCNHTLLPPIGPERSQAALADVAVRITAADVCACNQLLDQAARTLLNKPFDEGGETARRGSVREPAFARLRAALEQQASAGRSLGTGDRMAPLIDVLQAEAAPADLLRTACEAVAETLAARLANMQRVLIGGGGAKNAALVDALAVRLRVPVERCDAHGVPAEHREAAEIAVLGALCADGVPITLPQVTGVCAPAPRAGIWAYPPA